MKLRYIVLPILLIGLTNQFLADTPPSSRSSSRRSSTSSESSVECWGGNSSLPDFSNPDNVKAWVITNIFGNDLRLFAQGLIVGQAFSYVDGKFSFFSPYHYKRSWQYPFVSREWLTVFAASFIIDTFLLGKCVEKLSAVEPEKCKKYRYTTAFVKQLTRLTLMRYIDGKIDEMVYQRAS